MTSTHRIFKHALLCISLVLLAGAATLSFAQPTRSMTKLQTPEDAKLLEKIGLANNTMRRFGIAEAPEKTPGSFRLTTYNIENLFDDIDDPTLSGRDEDIDDTKPHHQMMAVAQAIREVNADVLCVQEIESREALDMFISKYIPDMGYDHVVSLDAGNSRGIENAVLSRFPLSNPQLWIGKELGGVHPDNYGPNAKNFLAGEPIAFRRSPLKVDVEIPINDEAGSTWTLTLFVVHHKSGRYSGYWREAEARTILNLANEVENEHPGRAIVILGDFNAQPSDESVQIYLSNELHDVFSDAKQGEKGSISHESGRRIDLLLMNTAAREQLITGSGFVLGTAARPSGVSWRDLDTFEGYAADHYPVSCSLKQIP